MRKSLLLALCALLAICPSLYGCSSSEPEKEAEIPDTESVETSEALTGLEEAASTIENSADMNVATAINEVPLPVLMCADLDVYYETDYAHGFDNITLGNDEGLTIQVIAPLGTTYEELIIYGEEGLVNIELVDQRDSGDKTTFVLYVTINQPCTTNIMISAGYEVLSYEEYEYCDIEVTKLNSTDGRVAYLSPTGDYYHFSSSCAGDNYITTTYYDCYSLEIEPCSKCAQ